MWLRVDIERLATLVAEGKDVSWRAVPRPPSTPAETKAAREPTRGAYFVQPDGEPFVKIGYAKEVGSRVTTLQTSHYRRLTLLAVVPGGPEVERRLHVRFAEYRVRGEWFRLEGRLLEFIKETTK